MNVQLYSKAFLQISKIPFVPLEISILAVPRLVCLCQVRYPSQTVHLKSSAIALTLEEPVPKRQKVGEGYVANDMPESKSSFVYSYGSVVVEGRFR